MDVIKNKVVYLFFIHVFLRRIGKRYPEFFKQWINDYIENRIERRVLIERYTGDTKKKFAAIAIDMGMDERNVYRYHKNAVERLTAL